MSKLPTISVEFLQNLLGRHVIEFTLKPGTNLGDNYTSVMYSIEVFLSNRDTEEIETIHLISKCYPTHPGRQEFLIKNNVFWKELSIYQELLPELDRLSESSGIGKISLFPPLIGGKAPNFEKLRALGDTSHSSKIFQPFDIYMIMKDMRPDGYKMGDRQAGLGYDEMRLVVGAQAQLHALSWAFKKTQGIERFGEKFPFLDFKLNEDDMSTWVSLMTTNVNIAADTIAQVLGDGSPILERTKNLSSYARSILDVTFDMDRNANDFYKAHRIPPEDLVPTEEPWRVLIHGDCWTNNVLFRASGSSTPSDVILVDLQLMRENCPTVDLVYLMYTSTTSKFRNLHLTSLLTLYHDEFSRYCRLLKVPQLPGFTLEELSMRFRRGKIYGFLVAATALPIMLKDAGEVVDMETVAGTDFADVVKKSIGVPLTNNGVFVDRIVATAEELYAEGIL